MDSYQKLLLSNQAWVQEKLGMRSDYFSRMANDQSPEFLWIGCSDSRVPAEDITGAGPGEIFVHRNIANLVIPTDFNILSVLQFAVEVLGVKHIIVCGHYGCGGVKHSLSNKHLGLINKWLKQIKDVYNENKKELEILNNEAEKINRMVELNVIKQIQNLAQSSIVQRSWAQSNILSLHGWVYDIASGYVKDLCLMTSESYIDPVYKYDFTEDQIRHYSEEV